jgi:hypothetical protein
MLPLPALRRAAAVFAVLVAVGRLPAAAAAERESSPAIQPLLEKCTLEVGGRTLTPVRTASPAPRTYRVSGLRLTVRDNTVRGFRSSDAVEA